MSSQANNNNSQQEPLLRPIEDAEYESFSNQTQDGAPAGSADDVWTSLGRRSKPGLPVRDSFVPIPSTFWPTSMTMTKAILGAGMMVSSATSFRRSATADPITFLLETHKCTTLLRKLCTIIILSDWISDIMTRR